MGANMYDTEVYVTNEMRTRIQHQPTIGWTNGRTDALLCKHCRISSIDSSRPTNGLFNQVLCIVYCIEYYLNYIVDGI